MSHQEADEDERAEQEKRARMRWIVQRWKKSFNSRNPFLLKADFLLNSACRHRASLKVINALIYLDPDKVSRMLPGENRNEYGGVPLHRASLWSTVDVVHRLLQVDPSTARVADSEGHTPLLWGFKDDYNPYNTVSQTEWMGNRLERRPIELDENGNPFRQADTNGDVDSDESDDDFEVVIIPQDDDDTIIIPQDEENLRLQKIIDDDKLYEVYVKACLIVQAGHFRSLPQNGSQDRIVHACAAYAECPVVLLHLAAKLQSNQLLQPDDDGNLPIHVALQGGSGASDKISLLVALNPSSASIQNHKGKLPLHIAVEKNFDFSTIEPLVVAYKPAVQIRDDTTGLYPFMQAAAVEDASVNNIYFLLRMSPGTVGTHQADSDESPLPPRKRQKT